MSARANYQEAVFLSVFRLALLLLLLYGIVISEATLFAYGRQHTGNAIAGQAELFRQSPVAYMKQPEHHSYKSYFRPYMRAIRSDMRCNPIPVPYRGDVYWEDSYGTPRSFGGERTHEGVDIMSAANESGTVPVVSCSDGTVTRLGWLKLGGYRVGIRSAHNLYFYYAHLESYAPGLAVGDTVRAGQLLGMMGDTGYGEAEGTTGMFPVHLHFGIYYYDENGVETSLNPVPFLSDEWK